MLVGRLKNCGNPTIGEKKLRPLPFNSGFNSSFALSCALLVIAPNSAHVVSLSAFTVRSGSALPSVHQNFQPISQGTYSASNFIRSRTIRAASITSLPTPSPGIHAILYLAIGQDSSGGNGSGKVERDLRARWQTQIAKRSDLSRCAAYTYGIAFGEVDPSLSRLATIFSAPPATISSCAAGLSAGKANCLPSTVRMDLA